MEVDEAHGMAPATCVLLQSVLAIASELMRNLPEEEAEPLGEMVPTLLTLLGACDLLPLGQKLSATTSTIECLDAARALPYHRIAHRGPNRVV